MKKVLVVANNNLGIGGIQNVIMSIVRGLNEDYQFDAIVFDHLDTYNEKEFLKQGKIFTIPQVTGPRTIRKRLDFYIRPIYMYLKIYNIIKENGPYDVIHCHNYFEEGLALFAAKNCGIRIRIAHSHSNMKISRYKVIRKLYEFVYRKLILYSATNLLACSKVAGEYLYGNNINTEILNNAINLDDFSTSTAPTITPWSFIHIGRWGNPKNQLFLIDVFRELKKYNSSSMLTLVGDGSEMERKKIKDKIKNYHLEQSVYFCPANTNIPQILTENNVFIFPSIFEGLGIVLIEAQASGMKCFASSTVPEEANRGLVEFIDLEEGAERWASIIASFIKENGVFRKKVDMADYDIKNVIKRYKKIYG